MSSSTYGIHINYYTSNLEHYGSPRDQERSAFVLYNIVPRSEFWISNKTRDPKAPRLVCGNSTSNFISPGTDEAVLPTLSSQATGPKLIVSSSCAREFLRRVSSVSFLDSSSAFFFASSSARSLAASPSFFFLRTS